MRASDLLFILETSVVKDFKVRYRNMSLGVFWSLVNPIVTMGVLTFVFTKVFPSQIPDFPVFVLCALVPFNFYSLASASGTTAVLESSSFVKRVRFPLAIIPMASVLSNCVHFLIQIALLLTLAVISGYGFNSHWVWLPVIWALEVVFVCGLVFLTSALDVFVRDMRYIVESVNLVMFWLVPIFYPFSVIRAEYHLIYQLNPIAAVVLACRNIILEAKAPPSSLMWKLSCVSVGCLALGFFVFGRLKRRFADLV